MRKYTPISFALSHPLSQSKSTNMGLTTEIRTNYSRLTYSLGGFLGSQIDNNNNGTSREKKVQQNMVNNYKRYKKRERERTKDVGDRQLHLISFQKRCLLGSCQNARVHIMNMMCGSTTTKFDNERNLRYLIGLYCWETMSSKGIWLIATDWVHLLEISQPNNDVVWMPCT